MTAAAKNTGKKLDPIPSENSLRLDDVNLFGLQVFGEMEKFQLWLNTPSMALGRIMPIELLGDAYGKNLVMTELNRIEYGIFV